MRPAYIALAAALVLVACKPPATSNGANAGTDAAPAGAVNGAGLANAAPTNAPAAAEPATGPDADAARAFLMGLYAHYKTAGDFQMFGKDEKAVFDADTIQLLAADTKALKGDLGEIDGDWLCNCQDYTSILATIAVQSATPAAAEATADYHDAGEPTRPPDHDSFDLVKTAAGWRIHDITLRGEPLSLRATLRKEIHELARAASAAP